MLIVLIVMMMHQRRRRASLLSPIPDPTGVRPGIFPRGVHPPARPRRSIRAADAALHRARCVEE